jgi:hypothetical protein
VTSVIQTWKKGVKQKVRSRKFTFGKHDYYTRDPGNELKLTATLEEEEKKKKKTKV